VPGDVFSRAGAAFFVRAVQHWQKMPLITGLTRAVIAFPAVFCKQALSEPWRKAHAYGGFAGFDIADGCGTAGLHRALG
jgi:hypothetical protein